MRTHAAFFFLLSFSGKWRAIKLICRFLVILTETCFFFGTFKETRCFVYFSFFCEFCSCFEFCSRCEFFINNEIFVINWWLCYYYNLNISFISILGPSIQATCTRKKNLALTLRIMTFYLIECANLFGSFWVFSTNSAELICFGDHF